MRKVAKAAGITRQTIYNHYQDINHAIIEGENYVIGELPEEIARQSERLKSVIPDNNYRLFFATMSFMAHRRDTFSLICNGTGSRDFFCRMSEAIYPRLEMVWLPKGLSAPAIDTKRVRMLLLVMAEILHEWGAETDCDVQRADLYIQRLLRAVADAAANRLP